MSVENDAIFGIKGANISFQNESTAGISDFFDHGSLHQSFGTAKDFRFSDANQNIIDDDEKLRQSLNPEFDVFSNVDDSMTQISQIDDMQMSWGKWFAQKSPPMGDLSGTSEHKQRPYFSQQNHHHILPNNNNNILVNHQTQNINNQNNEQNKNKNTQKIPHALSISLTEYGNKFDKIKVNKSENKTLHYSFDDDNKNESSVNEDENDIEIINDKEKILNFKIDKLKFKQKYYQFSINEMFLKENNNKFVVEKYIGDILRKYLNNIKKNYNTIPNILGINYNNDKKRCTLLMFFYDNNNEFDFWKSLIKFEEFLKIFDCNSQYYITNIC